MAEKNYGNNSQLSEIVKYISDTMKFPIMGAGGGFAPIGTESYFDGQVAPLGWVICDGTELNIADYPDLATYYASQHGVSNYYGGNGTTTFATPKRSGMPNGINDVDNTEEMIVGVDINRKPIYKKTITSTVSVEGVIYIGDSNDRIIAWNGFSDYADDQRMDMSSYWWSKDEYFSVYAIDNRTKLKTHTVNAFSGKSFRLNVYYTKTTDTAIPLGHSADGNGVFCIKATVSGDPNAHQYSTEEQVVGMTEDGEAIYEKTKKGLSVSVTTADSWQEIDTITGSKALYSATLYSDGGNDTLVIVMPREIMINNSQKLFIKGVLGSNRTISRYTVQYTKSS